MQIPERKTEVGSGGQEEYASSVTKSERVCLWLFHFFVHGDILFCNVDNHSTSHCLIRPLNYFTVSDNFLIQNVMSGFFLTVLCKAPVQFQNYFWTREGPMWMVSITGTRLLSLKLIYFRVSVPFSCAKRMLKSFQVPDSNSGVSKGRSPCFYELV